MFVELYKDLDRHILSFVQASDISRASRVSKSWNMIATEDIVWIRFFPKIQIPQTIRLKKHYDKKGIVHFSDLIKRVEKFCRKLDKNKNGWFQCHFQADTKCYFVAKIFNHSNMNQFDVKDFFWYLKEIPQNDPIKDRIIIGGDHSYVLHFRLPKNSNFIDITEVILKILDRKNVEYRKKISFTLRNT